MKTRRQSARDKTLKERTHEFLQWRRWRRAHVEALLAGPYGVPMRALLAFCKTMTGPSALIESVKAGPWHNADLDTRLQILSLLDAVIVKRRERMGLAPFDDALPGQPDNLFLILRELLAPSPGTQPGSINATPKIQEHAT